MPLNRKVKKRILIFIIVPVLTALPFFTDDFIIKIICAALTVIYVGFIIFLRYSVRDEEPISKSSLYKKDYRYQCLERKFPQLGKRVY